MERYAVILAAIILAAAALAVGYTLGSSSATASTTITATVTQTTTITKTNIKTTTVTETFTRVTTETVTTTRVLEERFPRTLIDAIGRNVTIPKPPERVASLSPAITETLWALGQLDKLVAVDHTSDYPRIVVEWKKEGRVVDVGGYWWNTISVEKLVEAKPDIVFAEASAHLRLLNAFKEYGLNVVYLKGGSCKSLEDVYHDIWLVGYALGAEDRAVEWISRMKANVTLLEEKLREANATTVDVLVVLWWSPQGVWSSGGDTFIADLVSKAGGRLVTSRYSGWVQIGLEELASYKPSIILYTGMSGADANQTLSVLREMASKEPLKSMVEHGARICGLYGDAVSLVLRPGPRAAMGVQLLAKVLHPEVFGEPGKGVVCLTR